MLRGQVAGFDGVLVPESNYRDYSYYSLAFPVCKEKLEQCTGCEHSFWSDIASPALFFVLGFVAFDIIK